MRNTLVMDLNLICVDLAIERLDQVTHAARHAVQRAEQLDDLLMKATSLMVLAIALVATAHHEEARASVEEALALLAEIRVRDERLTDIALFVLAMGVAGDDPDAAVMLWSTGERSLTLLSRVMPPELAPYVNSLLEPLRSHPGFEPSWQEGQRLLAEEALARGLGHVGAGRAGRAL